MAKSLSSKGGLIILGYAVLAGALVYGYTEYSGVKKELVAANQDIENLSERLKEEEEENENLVRDVESQQEIIDNFGGQIREITSTVGTLEKLAATDEELLQKYSRVYFLNENYVPSKLTQIDKEYTYSGASGNFLFHGDAWPFLEELIEDAHDDDIELLVASAFRSFDTQGALNASYKITYGTGANTFSAEQGYSEHQLGTTLDFTTAALGANFNSFASTEAYQWLLDNAHKYGFTLSYPEGNTYYKYEPWHWRFVGIDLATRLHEEGKYFYDLDQREIDKYLVKIFD